MDNTSTVLTHNYGLILLQGFIVLVIILLTVYYFKKIKPLLRERKHIIAEINRSSSRGEKEAWKKDLKELYRENLPFIGRFFR